MPTTTIVDDRTAFCPIHRALTSDFVASNSKRDRVFRCKSGHMGPVAGNPNPPGGAHYFTLSSEAVASLARTAKKSRGGS